MATGLCPCHASISVFRYPPVRVAGGEAAGEIVEHRVPLGSLPAFGQRLAELAYPVCLVAISSGIGASLRPATAD